MKFLGCPTQAGGKAAKQGIIHRHIILLYAYVIKAKELVMLPRISNAHVKTKFNQYQPHNVTHSTCNRHE